MEQRGLSDRESCYFLESSSSGNIYRSPYYADSSTSAAALPRQGPRTPSVFLGGQTLESSFSRLNLWSDQPPQAPQVEAFPTANDDVSGIVTGPSMGYYYPWGSARRQGLENVGLQSSSTCTPVGFLSGGQDLGFRGAHMDFMVAGPSSSRGVVYGDSCYGNVSLHVPDELDNNGDHPGIYGHPFSSLHSKQPSPIRMNNEFQNLRYPDDNLKSIEFHQAHLIDLMFNASIPSKKPCDSRPSGWLDQFKSLSLLDFTGRIVELAKDQNCSRVFQEKLDKIPKEQEIEMVLHEVIDHVAELMKNQFGSHFVQKLFAVCSEEQRTTIIVSITKTSFEFINICLNPYGARIMQSLLENLSTPEQISLVMSALCPEVVRLSTDPNGQHVMRFCLQNFSQEYNKHLLNEIKKHCFHIATDKSGCCLLQCCVDCAQGDFKVQLIREIIRNSLQLAQDPYGNYVIQHLLGKKETQKTEEIMRRLQGHFASLSRNKHGSHVVEKFLNDCEEEHTKRIILELLAAPNAATMLFDPFGNFVMQKALSVAKGPYYTALCKLIQGNSTSMRSNLYGRKVLTSFEKRKSKNV